MNLATVDPGPYTPGSTIATTFVIDAAACYRQGNVFTMLLSDANGNFSPGQVIGTYNSFYATFVNGIIPAGTAAGTGYKIRILSSAPATTVAESGTFSVIAGTAVEARIGSSNYYGNNQDAFGTCLSLSSLNLTLSNASTSGGNLSATIKDEFTGAVTNHNIGVAINFSPEKKHYTVFAKVVMPNGTIATKAYFIINNETITAFSTSGNNVVCLPGGQLTYGINVSATDGIRLNFPGNIYRITWGDGQTDTYNFCDLKNGTVSHEYNRSSCGQNFTSGNVTTYNVFGINIQMTNPYCGDIGTAISTTARVINQTVNKFIGPNIGCSNANLEFINTSILGDSPTGNSPGCQSDNVTFNWYINGVLAEANQPVSFRLNRVFPAGTYTIRLESNGTGGCPSDAYQQTICVEDPPLADFTLPALAGCAPYVLTPTNTSIVDTRCGSVATYNWSISPSTGVTQNFLTSTTSTPPTFTFSNPGNYSISLQITTPGCGTSNLVTKNITINLPRTVTLSPNITLCTPGTFNFSAATGVTSTVYSGSDSPTLDDTYNWTVTAANGGSFGFVGSSNTKYPVIKFDNFDTYTITSTVSNVCGTNSATQVITFTPSPVPDISFARNPICYGSIADVQGSISGSYTQFRWVGAGIFSAGNGFTSDITKLNTTYTPTIAEQNSGSATIQLLVNTGLSNCTQVERTIVLNILPRNRQTNQTLVICTGDKATYTPTSSVTGSTFTWTATNADGNASGFSTTGSGNIDETIINSNANNPAIVVYTITPESNGCVGEPFTLTVTVNPRPSVSTNVVKPVICSGDLTDITLTSNFIGAKFTWTSTATAGITGNSAKSNLNDVTAINDRLINNGTTVGTVTYIITPLSSGSCGGSPVTVTVNVDPQPTTPNAGVDEILCNVTSFALKGNTPTVGTGLWTEVSSFGVTFSDPTLPNAQANNLLPGNTYIFRWTITGSTNCTPKTDEVSISINTASVGGTTTGAATVCAGGSNGQINLSGQVGNILRWERSMDGINWLPIAITTNTISYTNLTTTTQYRAVVQSGNCPSDFSAITTITVNQGAIGANAGADQTFCNVSALTLSGNNPGVNTGNWTLTSGQSGVTIVDPSLYNTNVTGLVGGETYTFLWTISGLAPCPASSDAVVITNLTEILNNGISVANNTVCSGQTLTITGTNPTGGNGNYTYTWQSSTNGTTWTTINGETAINLNITATSNISYRRITSSGNCSSTSTALNIVTLSPIGNNNISVDQTICIGNNIAPIIGSQPTGGDATIYTYNWQQSINNGATWQVIVGANAKDYQPVGLTQTTWYRRLVSSASCSGNLQHTSNISKVNINPNARAVITYTNDNACFPFFLNASNIKATPFADRNATYTWYANNVVLGSGINFPGYTITTENTSVTIKLVTTSSFGCLPDETEHTFSTLQTVVPSYTQDKTSGCGPLEVAFRNTSNVTTGVTFKWDFGNNTTSTAANPGVITFLPDPSGEDKEYTISLEATSPCGVFTSTSTVLVSAPPQAIFSPNRTNGCAPFTVQFSNTSPGENNVYFYDFGDGRTLTTRSKQTVSHTYQTSVVQDFVVKMIATNDCSTSESEYSIRVSPNTITPALVVNGNQLSGCAPLSVDFFNNTNGASSYKYIFGDGGEIISNTTLPEKQTYVFTRPGVYNVQMLATNGCSVASASQTITVYAQPQIAFRGNVTRGCSGLSVKFTNTTTGATSYLWEFGDGETSREPEPTYVYNGSAGNYSVKLTAFNSQNCPTSVTLTDYIQIVAPPKADFAISPASVISIPDYTFNFTNESTNRAQRYEWNFGDKQTSTQRDPSHKYADTGRFLVTLKTFNEEGCVDSVQKYVQIVGVPGYVYLPNSFIPGGSNLPLQKFMAIGSGIKSWRMSVFNKWGQVVWETTQLEEGKPVEGWDGTYKNQPQPQGLYFWKMDVQLINGTEWKGVSLGGKPPKRTGEIYLIR
ncbi:MAG: PKD domain-containing protein [Flavobacteriales bacterium]|nr:MAG: PKD domain-containing protein [Flavobacteriales bacterium]